MNPTRVKQRLWWFVLTPLEEGVTWGDQLVPCLGAVMVVVSLPLATVVQSSLGHLTILLIKVSLFQENISDIISIIFIVIRLHIQCWGSHKALWCPDDNKSYNKPFLQHQRSTAAGRRLLQWPDLLVGCESRLQTCGSSGVWALPLWASLQHNLDSKQVWHRAHDWRLWWLRQVKFQQLGW